MKITINQGLVYGGSIIAIISALTLVSKHPINIVIMALGVCLYLLGKKVVKK